MATEKKSSPDGKSAPLQPNVREHGEWGTTDQAVGGFGESYRFQVASGAEDESVSPHSGPSPSVPEQEDATVLLAVQKSLARAHIDAADMRVEVHDQHVTVHGTVRHAFEKSELEARIRSVAGVRSVTSRLVALPERNAAT